MPRAAVFHPGPGIKNPFRPDCRNYAELQIFAWVICTRSRFFRAFTPQESTVSAPCSSPRCIQSSSTVVSDSLILFARTAVVRSCHCEEWSDEAISVLVSWRLLRGFALVMTIFQSFRVIKTDITFENPYIKLGIAPMPV